MALRYKKDFFEKHPEKYDYIAEEDFNFLIKNLPSFPSNGILLDLGCGSGINGERFQRIFPQITVIGTDISLHLLKWAEFSVCQSDAVYLPFKENSFDCIIAAAAFHHFPLIEAVVKESSRCLKPGGIFIAYDPNKFHPQRFIMMTDPLRHFFYQTGDCAISPKYFEKILLKSGIKKIKINYFAFKGKDPRSLSTLNCKIVNALSKSRFKWLIPILSPWFSITGIKS